MGGKDAAGLPVTLLARLDGGNDALENIAVIEAQNEHHEGAAPVHYLIKWNPRQERPERWLARSTPRAPRRRLPGQHSGASAMTPATALPDPTTNSSVLNWQGERCGSPSGSFAHSHHGFRFSLLIRESANSTFSLHTTRKRLFGIHRRNYVVFNAEDARWILGFARRGDSLRLGHRYMLRDRRS